MTTAEAKTPVQPSRETNTTGDASSLKNLKKYWDDLWKAERQGKQFTYENVNDKDVAITLDVAREKAGYMLFRGFTNDMNLRNQYSWLDYQVKATTVSEYIDALKDENVDNVVFVGQDASTMPTFYYESGSWHIDSEGSTAQQRELAQTIAAEGLEMAYAMKSPIERTAENAAYVSNRDAGSRAMWDAIAEEKKEAKTEEDAQPLQYSLAENEKSVLNKQDLARFYAAIGEMKIGKKAQFQKNADGLYMVAIGNKIVYTDGKWSNPSIEKVDVINKEMEAEIEPIRDIIFYVEQTEGISDEQRNSILTEVLKEEAPERHVTGIRKSNILNENGRGERRATDETHSRAGRDARPEYSVRFEEGDQWGMLIEFAKAHNNADLLEAAGKGWLESLFKRQNTKTSFQEANPIRIMKTLAASIGTQVYTADIKDRAVKGYSDVHAHNIVVDSKSAADHDWLLGMTNSVVYSKLQPLSNQTFSEMGLDSFRVTRFISTAIASSSIPPPSLNMQNIVYTHQSSSPLPICAFLKLPSYPHTAFPPLLYFFPCLRHADAQCAQSPEQPPQQPPRLSLPRHARNARKARSATTASSM